ncbi:MAG: SprT family zinc-dependent metalloprotease [Waddliaceae bacterium]
MSQERGSVAYGKTVIDFMIEHSARKTVAIAVHPDCEVVVTAPQGACSEKVRQLVHKRARWILKQKHYFEQFLPRTPSRKFVGGETHLYLGKRYRLKLISDEKPSVKLFWGYLEIRNPEPTLSLTVEKELYKWYKIRAEQKLRERFEACYTNFAEKHPIERPDLQIRKMKSRWGSYAVSGRLTLNLELIKAPIDCIDYIIIHELCHVIHHDHGAEFYRLLKLMMPDYLSKKNKLEMSLT